MRLIAMPDTRADDFMQDDVAAARLAAALGHPADFALAARIAALCRQQMMAARRLLDRVAASDDPAHHVAALEELARDG
jgi:hypothetical protein